MAMAGGQLKAGYVVGKRWQVVKFLVSGSFGQVYEVTDLITGSVRACKIESLKSTVPQLKHEFGAYKLLACPCLAPSVYCFGQENDYCFMILDRLGESLETLFVKCGRQFSLKTVCLLGIELLSRLQELHSNGFIHRDVKPDNFLVHFSEPYKVYVVDLGLAATYVRGAAHIPFCGSGKSMTGTPRYASLNSHSGYSQSRRDDLESLSYMLVYFAKSRLPWQGLTRRKRPPAADKYAHIAEVKRATDVSQLCTALPKQFEQFIHECRALDFKQTPQYHKYKMLFASALSQMGFLTNPNPTIEPVFDWQLDDSRRQLPAEQRFVGIPQVTRSVAMDLALLPVTAGLCHSYQVVSRKNTELKRLCDKLTHELKESRDEVKQLKQENAVLKKAGRKRKLSEI